MHLSEGRDGEQLLDPGQEVRYEGVQGGVKTLVKHFLEEKHREDEDDDGTMMTRQV